MTQLRYVQPGYVVIHPNRDRAVCVLTKLVVALILLASAALVLAITLGGWSKLQGMEPVSFIWAAVYVVIAFYIVTRWARGLLPIAAALGILLLVMAVIAAFGLDGTSWSARARAGFAAPHSLFGGQGFGTDLLGTLTAILIPVQLTLIVAAMIGFAQGWNVELEVPANAARERGSRALARGPRPAG
ncbi:MAG: hypothetical protein ACRDNF_07085 [Streptosporangiaceae bacterium]